MLFRIVQALFGKRSSLEIKNIPMLIGYNALMYFISALFGLALIVVSGVGFQVSLLTFGISALSGLSLFFASFCSIYAMKSGTVSLGSMFGTAGLIIPVIAGVLFFNTPVAPMQIIGLVLFFFSAYLLIGSSKTVYSNFSYKTLLLLLGSLLANGCTMLAQQMFTRYVPDGEVSVFSVLSFGIIAVLTGISYTVLNTAKKEKAPNAKLTKPLIVCCVALAISVFVINQLATMSTTLISPVILFTFINGGGTIISTFVAAIVYKERINKSTVFGILIGVISLVIIKAFE